MTMPQEQFKRALQDTLHQHLTISHPIFLELLDPQTKNLDLLRKVATQGYQLTKYFLTYV